MTGAGCQCEDMGDRQPLPRPAGIIVRSALIDLSRTARMHDVFETYLHALRQDRDDK